MADQKDNYTFPRRWAPPPDPDKPNCPYMPGFKVQITTHSPPPPFGGRLYGYGTRKIAPAEWLSRTTQSQHVLSYPPLETASPSEVQSAELSITKTLAIGNARGAQLVACNVIPQHGKAQFLATAKIFDALYYPFSDNIVSAPIDVVYSADMDYSREAAAYEHLRAVGNNAGFAPDYFGSWTFHLPITVGPAGTIQQRPVRLVLVECLDGSSMRDLYARNSSGPNAELSAFHYKEEYRLEILAQIMDGVMKQMHVGLVQRDTAPRNIMLVPPPQAKPPDHLPRVVLVDYNQSIVYEKTHRRQHACQDLALPVNPMEAYWTDSMPEFAGWIPPEWYENPRRRQEWLVRRFGGDKQSLYAAPIRKLEFTQLD